MDSKWNLSNLPPKGHKDVGPFAYSLFTAARDERERLELPDVWRENYKLFRGNHWGEKKKRNNVTVNLFFANVLRTVANITATEPKAECVDLDGTSEDLAKKTSARLTKWWQDSKQQAKLRQTAQNMEVNGITFEKAVWSGDDEPSIVVCDPFSVFPAPGYWEDIARKAPYICHAYPEDTHVVEQFFNTKEEVQASETYSTLGIDREEDRPAHANLNIGRVRAQGSTFYYKAVHATDGGGDYRHARALVVEVWVRDKRVDKKTGKPVYPGGIRRITITNDGDLVLRDDKNPSINYNLEPEKYEPSYLFTRFPFWKINSYDDPTSIWGFSAAEQVADLNVHIDEIFSRMIRYMKRALTGILVIPPNSGITKSKITNNPGLILFPESNEAAAGIRFVQQPPLPSDFYKHLDLLISFYDRIYAIQDVDRGEKPGSVTAASAIVALQERNAVLIQHKINAADFLVEQRGQCAISLWQNFGTKPETIEVNENAEPFIGIELAGKNFNYVVESGSSTPKTELQIQEQSVALYKEGAIDQQALLENINFPGWKEIVERMAEDKLGAVHTILVQAGMQPEQADAIIDFLSQPQGGPGNREQNPPQQPPQPGVPVAQQGQVEGVNNAGL